MAIRSADSCHRKISDWWWFWLEWSLSKTIIWKKTENVCVDSYKM